MHTLPYGRIEYFLNIDFRVGTVIKTNHLKIINE